MSPAVTDNPCLTQQNLEAFLTYCRRTRRTSAETVEWYRRHIERFLAARPQPTTGEDLMDWIHALPVSDSTRAGYWRALRAFIRWADARLLIVDFTRHINPRWSIAPHRMPPSAREFWQIIKSMPAKDFIERRNRVLFASTFFSCCRVSEIGSLTWQQLDVQERMIRVLGKGRKWRMIPAHPNLLKILGSWRENAPGRYVFPRSPEDDKPLHRTRLTHIWSDAQLAQGISKPWTYHDIRRAGASWLARNGMSLFAIQQLLGHSDIRTTQIYLSIDTATLREEMHRAWTRGGKRQNVTSSQEQQAVGR